MWPHFWKSGTRPSAPGCVACTLSSGLDSGAVTATAAHLSRGGKWEIHAYTSVPVYNTDGFLGDRYGDEFPRAAEVARFAGVEHHPVADSEDSLSQSPLKMRLSVIKPGRSFVGALHNERGMACGMEVRDPCAAPGSWRRQTIPTRHGYPAFQSLRGA